MVFIYGFGDLGDALLTESDAVHRSCPKDWLKPVLDALAWEEDQVLQATTAGKIEGFCLRFGGFYGPGASTERMAQLLRRRVLPIPKGALSRGPWIHIEDAATAVTGALSRGRAGEVYNILDEKPLPAIAMVRQLADAIHAPKPWPIPMWFKRLAAPFAADVSLNTTLRVSNENAKRDLAWQPRFRTITEGLRDFVRPNHDQTRRWGVSPIMNYVHHEAHDPPSAMTSSGRQRGRSSQVLYKRREVRFPGGQFLGRGVPLNCGDVWDSRVDGKLATGIWGRLSRPG
jgi:hypothetical protein